MNIDSSPLNLAPGMAVSAEIKTGKRRLIEFLSSPLLKYKQGDVRESWLSHGVPSLWVLFGVAASSIPRNRFRLPYC